MAAGDFSASVWPEVQVKALEMWESPRLRQKVERPVEAAKGFLENQLVQFDPVLSGRECIGVKATWLKDCDFDVIEDSNTAWDCDIAGTEAESDSEIYSQNLNFYKTFRVDDGNCDNQYTYADKVAYLFEKNKSAMDQALRDKILAALVAAAEGSDHANAIGQVEGTVTEILATDFDRGADLLGDFRLHADMNQMSNPYFITGTNFFIGNYHAQFEALNDDQRDRLAKYNAFANWYFDPIAFAGASLSPNTLMIDPGAAGLWHQTDTQSDEPEMMPDKDMTMKWKVDSSQLFYPDGTPIQYEVHARHTCARSNNNLRKVTDFRIVFKGGFVSAPNICDIHSGIVNFEKVESYTT
jgi:hypothetical protein